VSAAWAIILLVGTVLCVLAVAIAQSLLADEARAWLPHLARRLVRGAAHRLPVDFQARYEADWLAELAAWEDRPISALAKAAHIRWKVRAIRESLGGVRVESERAKRAFDLFFAMGLLVLLAPVILATAIAIKIDSPGPVFFRQSRAGRGDRSFHLIKFRSMHVDADMRAEELRRSIDAGDAVMFRIHRDPRVTRVGRTIRRYSLDELPQLLNVIKGDMSLVGPRPLLPSEITALKEEEGSDRAEVRPGLTGPGQIHYFGGGPQAFREEGSKLDEEYARSRSLLRDLGLLARTVWAVIYRGPRRP
jgi:lipopolysaccharide/colanic/teichoic acid biosynthesis glycosyltransferase